MGNICQICADPRVKEIDTLLLAGQVTQRAIANRFGFIHQKVSRHRNLHIAKALIASERAVVSITGPVDVTTRQRSLFEELEAYKLRADMLGKAAEDGKDYKTALLAIREMRSIIESAERILADRRGQDHEVAQSPSWKRLQSLLVKHLHTVPGALDAVSAALTEHLTSHL